jgi:proteasome accessory factor C
MSRQIPDSQVIRLLDLVPYLILNQGVSLDQIARDFQITKSDVLDDLNTLWMCGLPGYTPLELIDLSFDTGFVSIRNAEVLSNPRKLTSIEVGAIIIGLCILRDSFSSVDSQSQGLETLIERLSKKSNVKAPVVLSTAVTAELRSLLNTAITTKKDLIISYHSFSRDEITNREITPFTIVHGGSFEYLESFCRLAQDFRSFRLDRILSAAFMEKVDSQGPNNDPKEDSRLDVAIRITSNSRKVVETFHLSNAGQTHQGDAFKISVYNPEWIIRTICSLKSWAEVVQPPELRAQVGMRAQRALDMYV